MKTNTALQRMREGKPAIGVSLGLGSPIAGEFLSRVGFDFVLVDNQHGLWGQESTMMAFRNICLGPAIPMARVRQNDFGAIGRLLDVGALGVVVPMVNSAAEAKAAVRAACYPPRGGRSVGPLGALFHGVDYREWIDEQLFLAVQIESIVAVEHAEEILEVDGVDGCWVGPTDLSLSMGLDLSAPEDAAAHQAAILRVLDACHRTGKIPGLACSADNAGEWIDRGFQFVTAGSDQSHLLDAARETLRRLGRAPQLIS